MRKDAGLKDDRSVEKTVKKIFRSRNVAVLTTHGADYPHACLVAIAVTDDLRTIVFNTSRSTRKYRNIQENDRVTILVDDRSHGEEDFHRATVVTARGRAKEISSGERDSHMEIFLRHHPYLRDFVRSPTSVLMRVHVQSYAVVSRFQNVLILNFENDSPG